MVVATPGGVLKVLGDNFEAVLQVSDQIVAAYWHDNEGSVGQHLVRATSQNPVRAVSRFRQSVDSPVSIEMSLASHFQEVAEILAPGSYTFVLEDVSADSYLVEQDNTSPNTTDATQFYPGFGAMVATQPSSALCQSTVARIAQEIRRGERPTVVTVAHERAWAEFVIDGHHKLRAYQRENLPVRRLNITRQSSPRAGLEDLQAFLADEHELREHLISNRLKS